MNQLRNPSQEMEDAESSSSSIPNETDKELKSNWFQQIFMEENWDIKKFSQSLPFIFFMVVLGMLYITNIHILENKVRKIEKLNKEVKELSWEYKTRKAELMYKSKLTEVAHMVDTLGIKELTAPPKKIIVTTNEN